MPMASFHHFTPTRQVSARLAPLVLSSAVFLLRSLKTLLSSAVSSMHDICRKYKVHFALNMKIKSAIIYLLTDSDVRSLNTTIVEGLIERQKSRQASRETGGGLTGTYSGGSLGRTESMPK